MNEWDQASAIRAFGSSCSRRFKKHHDCFLLACPHVTKRFCHAGGVEVLVGHSACLFLHPPCVTNCTCHAGGVEVLVSHSACLLLHPACVTIRFCHAGGVEVLMGHSACLVLHPPCVTNCSCHAGGVEVLVGHSEVVMCDFAACLLAELERWMLNASPAMIDLNSFADTSDYFTAPTSALEEVSKRLYTDEVRLPSCMTAYTYDGHQSA